MKSPIIIVIMLFFVIVLIAGCSGTGKNTQETNPKIFYVNHTVAPSPHPMCPIPTLIYNNSQDFTKINTRLSITEPGKNQAPDEYPIPLGSIIYHTPGFITRIFDSTGNQILIVNDSENPSATLYFNHSESLTAFEDFNITYYINEHDQVHRCFAVTIYAPGSNAPVPTTNMTTHTGFGNPI
ncbi:MAG: hypothetical protein M0Q91_13110 [Methanoregula sp.]|jgi:hypothetical protein|nr:hypothetical protein [Methanoregula sp.]